MNTTAQTKTYDLIKQLLTDYPALRDSDKKLIWAVWIKRGLITNQAITLHSFMSAPSTETIRRCRQKIQEIHPELRSSKYVQEQKRLIEAQKGTYIFREQLSF